MKTSFRRIIYIIAAVSLVFSIIPVVSGCAKEAAFGELTICEQVNDETKEPVIIKNDFDFDVKEIFSTIKLENVNGDDNFRFLWKNADSGSIIKDITGKYMEGEKSTISAWLSASLTIEKDADLIALPGKYNIEFFHNGELKSSAEFTIKSPIAKILKVGLANEVSPESEPLNPTQEFSPEDTVYACAQLDYLVEQDIVKSKWFDENNNLILETPVTISDYYFKPAWVEFSLKSSSGEPMPAGKYKVDILLNDVLYGSYPFEIKAPEEEAVSGSVTFIDNNLFSEGKSEYYFAIMYPDNWQYSWQEDESSMSAVFTPLSAVEAVSMVMIVFNKGSYPENAKDTRALMDEIADQTRIGADQTGTGMEQLGEPVINEGKMITGADYTEYIYYFNNPETGEYGLIMSVFVMNDKMYIWYGFAQEAFYESLNDAYYGSFNSLTFTN